MGRKRLQVSFLRSTLPAGRSARALRGKDTWSLFRLDTGVEQHPLAPKGSNIKQGQCGGRSNAEPGTRKEKQGITARPVRLRCAPLRVTALTRARQDPRSASLPTTMLGAGRAGFRLRCAPLRVTALVRGLCDALAQSALQTITPAGARPSEPASAPVAGPGPAAASSRCRSPPGPRPMRRRKG